MEQPRSPEEIADINCDRATSDAEAIKDGAQYVTDPGTDTPRLKFTSEQLTHEAEMHKAERDPVYLREGKEAWQEDVNQYLYNKHSYHTRGGPYPFDFERALDGSGLVMGSDKAQQVAERIFGGEASAGHEFGKYLGGMGYAMARLMKQANVPEDVQAAVMKKYGNDVRRDYKIRSGDEMLAKSAEEYQVNIEKNFPELVPKDKSVHEMNPLIRPFLKPLSEVKGEIVPVHILRSAYDAGFSTIVGDFHFEASRFMDEITVTLKPWGLAEEIQKMKHRSLDNFVGPAWHSFPDQDSE